MPLTTYEVPWRPNFFADIIEHVPQLEKSVGIIHYLPHPAVYRADKEKLRVVYDAADCPRMGCYSLNESLYPGPVLLNSLAGILMRLRLMPNLVISDIEKAFCRYIRPEDRDATPFLWPSDPFNEANGEVMVYRFKRVIFWLICSHSSPVPWSTTCRNTPLDYPKKYSTTYIWTTLQCP